MLVFIILNLVFLIFILCFKDITCLFFIFFIISRERKEKNFVLHFSVFAFVVLIRTCSRYLRLPDVNFFKKQKVSLKLYKKNVIFCKKFKEKTFFI